MGSSLLIVTIAVRNPGAEGKNWSENVVLPPPATGVEGCAVMPKSDGLLPLNWTLGIAVRSRAPWPVLLMVKTL